ncbi:adult-specific cuticular protein ACP-20-like [Pollicipes pollicipes]|uniref:adult-specific cuticular protein ACP-20-like n=1 Tax=Pollicipes pollicipes TaxID=41117 RepID=UPI00188572F6|nr:adult-specific cuticular protein ACP-20-like [Pollicipes pollicipes]
MKVLFVFAVVLALATASDLRRYGGEQEEEEDSDHTPYQFSYSVDDEDTVFSQSEEGDDEGDVTGEYSVNLPDGRVQTVRYFGDNDDGYAAEVSYEGEAQYPEDQSYQAEEPSTLP